MMKKILLAAALMACSFGTAQAATLLTDNFDGYGPGGNVLNIGTNFLGPNWTTTPTLDYIVDNAYGDLCRGTGACIDLDGSTNHPGLLSSVMVFAAGTYKVAIELFGSGRMGYGLDDVTITMGNVSQTLMNIAYNADVSQTLTFTTTGGTLTFQNSGGNNVGAVLSSVSVTAVPVPAGGLLLISGLAGIAALRRRKLGAKQQA